MEVGQAVRRKDGRFIAGHTMGRPKGSRPKLSAMFWDDLWAVWQKDGRVVMRRLVEEDPVAFAKIVAMCVLKPEDGQSDTGSSVTVVNVITGVPG